MGLSRNGNVRAPPKHLHFGWRLYLAQRVNSLGGIFHRHSRPECQQLLDLLRPRFGANHVYKLIRSQQPEHFTLEFAHRQQLPESGDGFRIRICRTGFVAVIALVAFVSRRKKHFLFVFGEEDGRIRFRPPSQVIEVGLLQKPAAELFLLIRTPAKRYQDSFQFAPDRLPPRRILRLGNRRRRGPRNNGRD